MVIFAWGKWFRAIFFISFAWVAPISKIIEPFLMIKEDPSSNLKLVLLTESSSLFFLLVT